MQLATEEGPEGRAMALWMMVSAGLVPFGSLLVGVLAEVLQIRGALGIAVAAARSAVSLPVCTHCGPGGERDA